jgi:hypothetical protein
VRATSSPDATNLEPLPIDDESGTRHVPTAVTFELGHELIDAGRATVERLHDVPQLAPWTRPDPRPLEAPRPNPSAFVRMVELDAARLALLPDWWQQRAHNGRLWLTRRFAMGRPHQLGGTWTFAGQLRSAFGVRAIPFELTLWRQLDGWTRLHLQPERRVIIPVRYFREGHRALDLLIESLTRDFATRP